MKTAVSIISVLLCAGCVHDTTPQRNLEAFYQQVLAQAQKNFDPYTDIPRFEDISEWKPDSRGAELWQRDFEIENNLTIPQVTMGYYRDYENRFSNVYGRAYYLFFSSQPSLLTWGIGGDDLPIWFAIPDAKGRWHRSELGTKVGAEAQIDAETREITTISFTLNDNQGMLVSSTFEHP